MNPFAASIAAAQAAALQWASEEAVYVRRDGERIGIAVGVGQEQKTADGERTTIQADERDFFISAAELQTADGERFLPDAGDQVETTEQGVRSTWLLVPRRGGTEAFRPRDPAGTQLRLHTQLQRREPL